MSKLKVFCFGFGQVAESFINKLIQEKKDFDLCVTSRQETHQIEFNNLKINSYFFENDKFDHSIKSKIEESNYILISIPPINGNDIVAEFFEANVKNFNNCKWITYLSATSVYGDHKALNDEMFQDETIFTKWYKSIKAENSWKSLSIRIIFLCKF